MVNSRRQRWPRPEPQGARFLLVSAFSGAHNHDDLGGGGDTGRTVRSKARSPPPLPPLPPRSPPRSPLPARP